MPLWSAHPDDEVTSEACFFGGQRSSCKRRLVARPRFASVNSEELC